jgi:flavin reductase (DIM6/NTAB) family NADH-FMN oxidoreductase RutF
MPNNPPEPILRQALPADPLDTTEFRRLMGQFATGVCVVSTAGRHGDLAGITVNSLVSVSLDPLLVCWGLQNGSSQFELWSRAENFAVSILGEGQAGLARRYAARGSSELDPRDFIRTQRGLPVIAGALAHLECRQWSLYPAGDHTMVFGEVIGMAQAPQGRPLGYFGGDFCRIADQEP